MLERGGIQQRVETSNGGRRIGFAVPIGLDWQPVSGKGAFVTKTVSAHEVDCMCTRVTHSPATTQEMRKLAAMRHRSH